jgi:hypothetical protein
VSSPFVRTRPFIHEHADPAVQFLLRKAPGGAMLRRVEVDADLGIGSVRVWRYRSQPRVDTLRRALNALGYDLAVIDMRTRELL